MSNVSITRHDRGLDSKRIEKIIENINNRVQDIKYDRRDVLSARKEELKKEVIVKYNLTPYFDTLKGIDGQIEQLEKQIKNLKNQKEPYQIEIAKIMRGSESTYDYHRVKDGSPADEYMKQHLPNIDEMKEKLKTLSEEIEERLWLASDIEEARDLHAYALNQIKIITKGL